MAKRVEKLSGRGNGRWREELHHQVCAQCGGVFEHSRMRKFCSAECGYENKRKRITFNCDRCGMEVTQLLNDYSSHVANGEIYRGDNHWITGTKFSDEHRKKMSDAQKGELGHNWQGGKKTERELIRKSLEYKMWRESVFERDNYTCQNCLSRNGNGRKINLEAHHWLPFHMYISGRFETNNGHTLCVDCHNDFHSFCGVDYSPILEYV